MKKQQNVFEVLDKKYHEKQCQMGNHNFIGCDEWEKTCVYCGKFERK